MCAQRVQREASARGEAGAEPFRFDLRARRQYVSDEAIVAGLALFAKRRGGRAFGTKEWDRWKQRPCSCGTVIERFGSWRAGLAKVGVVGRGRLYTPEELVANLEEVWKRLKRPPGSVALGRMGRISAGPYRRLWGGVRQACEAVAAYHAGEIPWEELLRGAPSRKKARKGVAVGVRWRVLRRDGYRCVACGRSPEKEPWLELEVDHIVPASRGGGDEDSNLRTLCVRCNRGKGAGE